MRSPKFHIQYPNLGPGAKNSSVKIFNHLLLHAGYYTTHGKHYSNKTGFAVMAFRKVNGMKRTFNANPGIFKKLAGGKGSFHLQYPGAGKHVEVDISRQVMVLANHGKPQYTFHVSTGAPAHADDPGPLPLLQSPARLQLGGDVLLGVLARRLRDSRLRLGAALSRQPRLRSQPDPRRAVHLQLGRASGCRSTSTADVPAGEDGEGDAVAELREHALVIGEVTLSSGRTGLLLRRRAAGAAAPARASAPRAS